MMSVLDDQLALHEGAAICGALLIRPGRLPDEPDPPIVGEKADQTYLMAALSRPLALAWPEHPNEPSKLSAFLEEALDRFSAKARELGGEEDFVPAAGASSVAREIVFEHLKTELLDIWGGIESELFWQGFDALDSTAPIKHLTLAGLLTKMRSLGAFLIGRASRYEDELTATEFFAAGAWEQTRDAKQCEIDNMMRLVNKQFSHLTLSRPLPEERDIYAPASYRPWLDHLILVFEDFNQAVDERLLPDWWRAWFADFRAELH